MQYTKPPLSFEQQAELVISRGLVAEKQELVNCLANVSYYRLSGYLYPYRNADDTFKPETSFQQVWTIYRFDRQFRLLLLDAIERIEIAIRTQLTYMLSQRYGPFAYTDHKYFPGFKTVDEHGQWILDLKKELDRSREDFLKHFAIKYGDTQSMPPLWMATEAFTFGKLLTMYTKIHDQIRKETAKYFKTEDRVLESWLRSINGVRNIAAHHGRLWNRKLGYKPLLPGINKNSDWHGSNSVSNERIFIIILILRYLLKTCAPASQWPIRLEKIMDEFDAVPAHWMGFPADWKNHPLWRIS